MHAFVAVYSIKISGQTFNKITRIFPLSIVVFWLEKFKQQHSNSSLKYNFKVQGAKPAHYNGKHYLENSDLHLCWDQMVLFQKQFWYFNIGPSQVKHFNFLIIF